MSAHFSRPIEKEMEIDLELDQRQVSSLIFGFLRAFNEASHVDIMIDLIIHIITIYFGYYVEIETHWDQQLFAEDVSICDENKRIITNDVGDIGGSWRSFYLVSYILGDHNNTIISKFKLHSKDSNDKYRDTVNIGISCGNHVCIDGNFADFRINPHGKYYTYTDLGTKQSHKVIKWRRSHKYGERFSSDDIIWMKLEFIPTRNYGKLYFRKNNGNKWMDTQYEIEKNTKIKIAASLHSDSGYYTFDVATLELISVKAKDNNQNTFNDYF